MAKAASRFAACVAKASKRPGVYSPRGVCATAGRAKYGAKRFQKMAAAGRRRKAKGNPPVIAVRPSVRKKGRYDVFVGGILRFTKKTLKGAEGAAKRIMKANSGRENPVDAAADTFRAFHGHDPEDVFTFHTPIHEHSVLSGIGKLVRLVIKPEVEVPGVRVVVLEGFGSALLAQNEKGQTQPQLYIEGGDQSVDLRKFGITNPHEFEVLGRLRDAVYHTVKTHLEPEDGGKADYRHLFGKKRATVNGVERHIPIKGARLPLVTYDVRNKLISITGGTYDLPEVGIRG